MAVKEIKYIGEEALHYLIEKCKATFALITHTHTAADVGADEKGAASAALSLAESYTDEQVATVNESLYTHTDDSTIHVTSANKTQWNSAYTHSTSAHAPSTAEKNIIVGIQKNGTDLTVNSSTRKVNITVPTTASEVGADEEGAASNALSSAKSYTDSSVSSAKSSLQTAIDEHVSDTDVHFTSTERTKLSGIAAGAQVNSVTGVKGNSESSYRTGNINITPANIGLGNVNNTSDANKPVSTAQQTAIDEALSEAESYTDTKISNMVGSTSVSSQIGSHNTSTSAHSDIRILISDLTTKLNNFLDVDDTTTDQLSEVITLINNNKGTLESLTTTKINVSDIVDNLTTSSTSKVLSAKQGVAIKALIDALQVEVDEHEADTTAHITSTERTNWGTAYTHSQTAHAPSNAQANQNAFSNITIGSTTIAADSTTDTLTLVGSNVTLTPDATNDKVTIAVADGTTSAKGIVQLTNSTSSTSTTTAATPNSVKSAYDLANTAKTNAATAQDTADSKIASVSLASGTNNGTLKLTVDGTATDNIAVKGLGTAAYTSSDAYATSGHTHNYAGSSSAGGAATSANKLNTDAGSATQPVYFENGVPKATTYTLGKSVPSSAVFTDTHYASSNVVGGTSATSNTTSALTNGNVYLNSVENGVVTSSHKISGSGATTVTTDANGNIVISSTDNNTVYTHPSYTARTGKPTANQTPAFGGTVTISQITSDATGHVTNATDRTITIPSTTASTSANGLMTSTDKSQLINGGIPIVTTAGTGAAYTATIDGITALTTGMKVTIIPHTVSTSTAPTFNLNSLGAKTIRQPVAYNNATTAAGAVASWLTASKPITLMYDGTYWRTVDFRQASVSNLNGTLPITKGGTGATTAKDALSNLGITYGTSLPDSGTEGQIFLFINS